MCVVYVCVYSLYIYIVCVCVCVCVCTGIQYMYIIYGDGGADGIVYTFRGWTPRSLARPNPNADPKPSRIG